MTRFQTRPYRFRSLPASGVLLTAVLTLGALALPAALAAATFEKPVARTIAASGSGPFDLENLAGQVEVVGGSGREIRVTATIHAEANSSERARELADSLEIRFEERGGRQIVAAIYPIARHRTFHYPDPNRSADTPSWLSWLGGSRSETKYRGERVTVVRSPSSGSVTLWADFRVELPAGVDVNVKNAVGTIRSEGVRGDQNLDSGSGDIHVRDSEGDLLADTGSGDVEIERHRGEAVADTGSGDVAMSEVTGNVKADTGSGDVVLIAVHGAKIVADTGSGAVRMDDVAGDLDASTGSGDVVGRGLVAGRRLRADTGSGDVRLAGDFSAVEEGYVDTGSGSVDIALSAVPDVMLLISTGSGSIDVDLPELSIAKSRRSFFEGRLKSGTGNFEIDTGSGDVSVTSGR